MSVIVKGMRMPTKCCDCDAEISVEDAYWYEFSHECSFIYNGYTDDIRELGRLEECPLRPLPEKHGRLGDLDALYDSLGVSDEDLDFKYMLEECPTIVEAEGD